MNRATPGGPAPSLRAQNYYEHVHRYAIAGRACAGRRVLDLACGDGHGAAYLARRAAHVLGIDADETTVARARRNAYLENAQFVRADPENLPLVDGSVDVVTCFDTVERVANAEAMIGEIRRVLAPGGILFVSSSNKLEYTDAQGNRDVERARELYFEEFRDLLQRNFTNVRIYGQRLVTSSVVHPLGAARERSAGWISGNANSAERGLGALENPVSFLAVCSYGPLPDDLASGFVDPGDDLLDPPDELAAVPDARLRVRGSAPARILVACAPKSGSTYVAGVLASYFDARVASSELREMQWEAEQNLTRGHLAQLGNGSYVMQLHMKPFDLYLSLMREYGISLLVQWRNLGDAILSLDEHLAEFGVDQPLCYIPDGEGFLSLPRQDRYQYLIRSAVQWYVWFYLAWRKRGATFGVYERMVEDPENYFDEAIRRLGFDVDRTRLTAALEQPAGFTRFNVGRAGRSADAFSEDTKRLLETTIASNPWADQLDVLLWELPWDVPGLATGTPFDGSVVQPSGRLAEAYFVSRGMRHRLIDPPSWIASRAAAGMRAMRKISARDLGALPEASPIA